MKKQIRLQHKLSDHFRRLLFSAFYCLGVLSGTGQVKGGIVETTQSPNLDYKRTGIFVNVSAGLTHKAIIRKTTGPYEITANSQPAFGAGGEYRSRIAKDLYAIVGIGGIVTGRNAMFHAPVERINPNEYRQPFPPLKVNEFDFVFSAPILIEYNRTIKHAKAAFVSGGINFRYSLGYDVEGYGHYLFDTTGAPINVFRIEASSNNKRKPWITFNVGGGYEWRLKNYNILKAGIFANLSFTKFVNGTYHIDIPGEPNTMGNYGVKGTSLVFQVSYGFTGANRSGPVLAQKKTPVIKKIHSRLNDRIETVFGGNHFSVGLSYFSTSRANIRITSGNYPLSSSRMPGGGLKFDYQINFNKDYSIKPGIEIALAGRNFNLNVYKEDFSPSLKRDYFLSGKRTYAADLLLSARVLFQRRFFNSQRSFIHTAAGGAINFSPGADFEIQRALVEDVNNQIHSVLEMTNNVNNDTRPWTSLVLEAGYNWILNNNNILQVSAVTNLSLRNYANGSYVITIPGRAVTEGAYSAKGSYVGITFGYTFTNANYRIRKEHEPSKTMR